MHVRVSPSHRPNFGCRRSPGMGLICRALSHPERRQTLGEAQLEYPEIRSTPTPDVERVESALGRVESHLGAMGYDIVEAQSRLKNLQARISSIETRLHTMRKKLKKLR